MSGETKEVLGSNYGQNDVIINRLIDKMTLFDDNLMSLVFGQNIETTELLLRVIMERDIKVIDVRGQDELKNPVIGGRCITLDVHAIDVDGRHIDIEVQINAEGSHVRRARYHSSMMDARMLQEGQKFKEIKDSYVIFIYDHDKFRKGLPFYHIQRRGDETGEVFGDGSHIIYVNGRYEGNDDIGRMMRDFHQCRPEQIESETLSKAVAYYKEKEGRGAMSEAVRQYAMEYAKEYADWGADLTLCGHNHGGLIRIPGVGSLISPQFQWFPKYDAGSFEFDGKKVIVSRGLGTHTFHIRIFNRAELVFVVIKPQDIA